MPERSEGEQSRHRCPRTRRQFVRAAAGFGLATTVGVTGGRTRHGERTDRHRRAEPTRTVRREELWRYETGGEVNSSPTVVDGTVFVGSHDTHVYALDAYTGTEEWRFETGDIVRSSPGVEGDAVFVGSFDGNVYALDVNDGTERWRFETGAAVRSSPATATRGEGASGGATVVVGSRDGSVYALDAAGGDEQWRFQTGGFVDGAPAVVDGTVYVGSDDDTVYALDASQGTEQWQFEAGKTDFGVRSSPTVIDGTVFVGSHDTHVYALDADDGTEQWRFGTDWYVFSSPTVHEGTVFVGGVDGTVYALDAADGAERWQFETDRDVFASPTVVGDTVVVGSFDGNVYALDVADGSEQWRFGTGDATRSSSIVVDGTVYVGSQDGNVYALDAGRFGSSAGSRARLGTLGHHHDRSTAVTTSRPASFELGVRDLETPVTAGEAVTAVVEVANAGEQPGTETVELTVEDVGSDSTGLTLEPGESIARTLSVPTTVDESGGEYVVRVAAGDAVVTETIALEASGDDGLRREGMLTVIATGGLATAAGAYALLRRSDDD